MSTQKKNWAYVFALFFSLAGCGGGNDGGADGGAPEQSETASTVTLDSELDSEESQAVSSGINSMSEFVIRGEEIRGFQEVFQGNSSSSVSSYFNERVNYAISASTELIDRTFVNGKEVRPPSDPPQVVTLALNWSKPLWLLTRLSPTDKVQVKINEEFVDISSTRIGLIQLGPDFPEINELLQVTTLVHEARHSDCTGGLPASDLERVRNGLRPENNLCGHAHVACPPGHELEGEPGCDSHPWGAYTVNAIYTASLALACSSCTEVQKAVADIITIDSINRLLFDFQALLNGDLGPADMSSSDQII